MKKKSLLIRLIAVVAAMMCALSASAAFPYAIQSPDKTTLTFYYDNNMDSRPGQSYSLNTGNNEPEWQLNSTYRDAITTVVFDASFKNARPTSTYYWFSNMSNLTTITGISNLNTSQVTTMSSMFSECKKLESIDLSGFNTSRVENMSYMFNNCSSLTSLSVSNFNTSQLATCSSMFSGCSNLSSVDLTNFTAANVTNLSGMFSSCTGLHLIDLRSLNTANVSRMSWMFSYCSNLRTIIVSDGWNTDAVALSQSTHMFYSCTNLVGQKGTTYSPNHNDKEYAHIDGGPSNPGYLTDVNASTAYACYTSSNTTLTFYYDNQRSSRTGSTYDLNTGSAPPVWYNSPIKTSVTKVVFDSSFANYRPTTTYSWFYDMENLQSISNISNLNTSEVTNMRFMFCNCKKLQSIDLSGFNTANVTDMGAMFWWCSSLTSLDLSCFNTSNVTKMDGMFLRCTGLSSLDLSTFNTAKVTNMSEMFYVCSALQAIYVGDGWTTLPVITSNDMFYNCYKLVGGQGTTFNESNPTDKSYARIDGGPSYPGYFRAPNAPDPPIAYACYTPGNVTLKFYYDNLRSSRSGVTYDLNTGTDFPGWYSDGTYADVSWVVFDPSFANARPTSICFWFSHMENLRSITGLSYLNTSKVTAMISVFYNCSQLTSLDLSNFNTSQVTVMTAMFENCSSLPSIDLSSFNTSNVTIMNAMFRSCTSLTNLDLSSFNTSNVTLMSELFARCNNLRTIYVGTGWSTASVTSSDNMFQYCSKLVGGQGTAYNSSNPKDKTYARIDGGPSNPGYFTDTNAPRAYACYTPSNTTLTFYYDEWHHSRPGTTYDLIAGASTPGWKADGNNANVTRVVFDPSFAEARPTTTCSWFDGMGYLAEIKDLSNLNTSSVTNMDFMFYMCENLINLDLSSFNTETVTSMNNMFKNCTGLKVLYLNSFDTRDVTDVTSMFEGDRSLQAIYVDSGWTTWNVTASGNMFNNCTSLVGGQGTRYSGGNPKDKTYAHIDGGTSNPGYLTDINAVESYAEYSDGTLTFYYDGLKAIRPGNTYFLNAPGESPAWSSYFNAVNTVVFDQTFAAVRPTSMRSWFDGMGNLTSITGMEYLNTSQVTDMHSLFNGCSRLFGVDLSNFDTRNVTDMNSMFRDCAALQSLAVSSFDTRNVTDMNAMFRGCTGLTELDLSSFNTASVTKMIWMFYKCTNLATITVGSDWNTANVISSGLMFGDCTSLVGGQGTAYSDSNPKDKTYAHIDGGSSNPGYFTGTGAPYAVLSSDGKTLTFYCDNQRPNRPGAKYDLNEGAESYPEWYNEGMSYEVTRVVFDPSFANARPTTTSNWFAEMYELTSVEGTEYLNTSIVTSMGGMFWECGSLPYVDVSGFDTHNVTKMNSMFAECYELTGIDVSGFDTQNVTDMSSMFSNCSELTFLDVSGFNTAKVTSMYDLFGGCGMTSLDLSSFDTHHVTNMCYMFSSCSALKTIYVGNGWSTAGVTDSDEMFYYCLSLVGGKGTTYNSSNPKDKTYAHIDGGPSNPGYFSAKGAGLRGDVNGDNLVNISDAIVLINYLSTGNTTGVNLDNADCTLEGQVNISDAISLINYLLTGVW